jgi:hypothetical protein
MRKSFRYSAALCLVAIGTLALASTSASAAYQGYLHTEGKKQGKEPSKATSSSVTKPVEKPTPQLPSGARHK